MPYIALLIKIMTIFSPRWSAWMVSVVPIQVDMTDYGQMENLRNILAPDTDN